MRTPWFLAIALGVAACTGSTTDKTTDTDTDTDTDTMDSDTDTMDTDAMETDYDALACETVGASATTLVASDSVDDDGMATIALDLPHTLTLPSSGVGYIAFDNDEHREVYLYTSTDASVTAVHDPAGGSSGLAAFAPVDACPTDLAGGVETHLHPQTWIFEVHGPADTDVWMLVLGGAEGHMGMDTDMDSDTDMGMGMGM